MIIFLITNDQEKPIFLNSFLFFRRSQLNEIAFIYHERERPYFMSFENNEEREKAYNKIVNRLERGLKSVRIESAITDSFF